MKKMIIAATLLFAGMAQADYKLSDECSNNMKAEHKEYLSQKNIRPTDFNPEIFYAKNYQDGYVAVAVQSRDACLQVIVDTGSKNTPRCKTKAVFSTPCG